MSVRHAGDGAGRPVDGGIGDNRRGITGADFGFVEKFARKINPADRRILIDVAQDVGQLQRPAELSGKLETRLLLHAEDPDGEAPHGTGDPLAIEVQSGKIRRANILDHVHFHAVDDREEVLLAQPKALDGA